VLKLVVGLGNPGEEYESTRHNIGYEVVQEIRARRGRPYEERRARSIVSRVTIDGAAAFVARPLTYMNRSGAAVAALLLLADAGPEDLLVICDDLYLEFGTVRLRASGSHGGHNGLLSVIETLGTRSFARLRVGVGPADPGAPHADFVLAAFRRRERPLVPDLVRLAADCAETAVTQGVTIAMNRCNASPRGRAAEGSD